LPKLEKYTLPVNRPFEEAFTLLSILTYRQKLPILCIATHRVLFFSYAVSAMMTGLFQALQQIGILIAVITSGNRNY
jgi:hypothetical protein